ncbi:MAG: hypothetical protein NTZ59_05415 [Bacteroidetes bacterium]|jgi:hypothetical protein|nr:hypothetical protein [Bacteroidota bacterium]
MVKKILCIAFIAIMLVSCKTKNAFNYSQDIVKKETALVPAIEKAENEVAAFIEKEMYDSVILASKRMETLVQKSIDEIKATPAPEATGGDAFKAASLRYFEYLKSIYTSYVNYGKAATEEDRQTSVTAMMAIVDKKQSAIDDMQGAQRKFAKANGFQIEGEGKK